MIKKIEESGAPTRIDGAFREHDHADCAKTAMAHAERICADRSARLTPIRRSVLEILWESHQPTGAYDILDRLRATGVAAQPPAVYRALEFLIAHGLAHRIASTSAFIGCTMPASGDSARCPAHFVLCSECGDAAELIDPAIDAAIDAATKRIGFAPSQVTLEIAGLCGACAALTRR